MLKVTVSYLLKSGSATFSITSSQCFFELMSYVVMAKKGAFHPTDDFHLIQTLVDAGTSLR